jgi:hypothetical protein
MWHTTFELPTLEAAGRQPVDGGGGSGGGPRR